MSDNHDLPVDQFESEEERHDHLLRCFAASGATIEDLARAWASMDGKCDAFDAEKGKSVFDDDITGHYAGYLCEAEEIFRRATRYARDRGESGG